MKVAVDIQPADASPAAVEYTWDPDTDILSAQLRPRTSGDGLSGSVGLEGSDGSWVILDVAAGRIAGEYTVPAASPRSLSWRMSPDFSDAARQVSAMLREGMEAAA